MNLKLSHLGLSRAQLLQTSVNEILERTRNNIEKNKCLTQSQIFNLREKIIEAKKILEMHENIKKYEKRAKKRKDASSIEVMHSIKNQFKQIQRHMDKGALSTTEVRTHQQYYPSTDRVLQPGSAADDWCSGQEFPDSHILMQSKKRKVNILTEDTRAKLMTPCSHQEQTVAYKNHNYSMYKTSSQFYKHGAII